MLGICVSLPVCLVKDDVNPFWVLKIFPRKEECLLSSPKPKQCMCVLRSLALHRLRQPPISLVLLRLFLLPFWQARYYDILGWSLKQFDSWHFSCLKNLVPFLGSSHYFTILLLWQNLFCLRKAHVVSTSKSLSLKYILSPCSRADFSAKIVEINWYFIALKAA